jgi:hypothetical protein
MIDTNWQLTGCVQVCVPHTVELANLTSPTLGEVVEQAHRGIQRVRDTPHLAYPFLRRTGLSVS